MSLYFNEFDKFPADWLRNLYPAATVDDRSIADVRPEDLRGFDRAHFFAGIGGWELALDLAGVPLPRRTWTGSCPCQPFSSAGKGKGGEDDRDLWPVWFRLVRECRPELLLGEQVASAIGHGWLDRVHADLEAEGYAVGAVVLGAHSVGAPHIRQRLYWMAYSADVRRKQHEYPRDVEGTPGAQSEHRREVLGEGLGSSGSTGDILAYAAESGRPRDELRPGSVAQAAHAPERLEQPERYRDARALDYTTGTRLIATRERSGCVVHSGECVSREGCAPREPVGDAQFDNVGRDSGAALGAEAEVRGAGDTDGSCALVPGSTGDPLCPWDSWVPILCTDGKWRRVPDDGHGQVEPSLFPLASGVPGRVGRLRAYGNAIVPQVAAQFVRAVSDMIYLRSTTSSRRQQTSQ